MRTTPLQDWIAQKIAIPEEHFSRGDLEIYQLQRLQWSIQHARQHSRFYREWFAQAPPILSSLDELKAFPFTTAEDIRSDPNRFVCVSQDEIHRIVTLPTSGTTGASKRIFFTLDDQELTIDFFKVGMSTLAQKGDRVLILLPGQRPGSVGYLLKIGLERLGCAASIYGPVDNEEKVLEIMRSKEINVLVGAPVHLHRLARWDEANKILPKSQIRSVLSSTDTLANTIRTNLQSIWSCEVFDHWGMTETGLGGGVECEAHQGFHLREADLYFEIIDPESGLPLPDGETGEVVVTTLTRVGMPLIRYRTGDLSRLIPGACPCRSLIKRLDRIGSRVDAGIRLGSGLLTQLDLDEVLFQTREVVDFSAFYLENSDKRILKLAVRTINGQFKNIESDLFESLFQIPALQTELENGTLDFEFTPLEKPLQANPNVMYKRMIIRRTNE